MTFRTRTTRAVVVLGLLLVVQAGSGCASLTNPTADGIPARLVPRELLAPSKAGTQAVPLNLLRQTPPKEYQLAPGDVLGVYVEGYLGEKAVAVPVHVGPLVQPRDQYRQTASMGYPVPVGDNGTIDLPGVGPLAVQGLTLDQARDAIQRLYVSSGRVKPEVARIIVTHLEPRRYNVLVLRQEAAAFNGSPESFIPTSKRGAGYEIQLPAYQNDVLHALTRTGGLPGLDAHDEVVIFRDCVKDPAARAAMLQRFQTAEQAIASGLGSSIVRIPLRQPAGNPVNFKPEDVVLGQGDVVYLPARDEEVFYTGGLLPPGVHVLPRDRNLDVLEAVSLVRGALLNGAFGGSNLSGTLIQPGIGNPSPALLTIVRKTPNGGQVNIAVDLDSALRHPEERLNLQAGDLLVLQERPGQAIARYLSQTAFNFNFYWQAIRGSNITGIVDAAGPDRIPGRGAVFNINQNR